MKCNVSDTTLHVSKFQLTSLWNPLSSCMANNETKININGGGCLSIIIFFLCIGAVFFGLPTPWGVLNIDLFPPGIFLK